MTKNADITYKVVEKRGSDDAAKVMFVNNTTGNCLDVTNNPKKGTILQSWKCNKSSDNQRFDIIKKNRRGERIIKSVKGNMCLDVAGKSTKDGAKIILWSCNGGANQSWNIINLKNNWFHLHSKHSRKYLDLGGGNRKNGAKYNQWACRKGNNNQRFRADG